MGILGEDDIEMESGANILIRKKRKGVKNVVMKEKVASLAEKSKKINKKLDDAAIARKENSKKLKMIKNLRWMNAVKEISEKPNLKPIHKELLSHLVGRSCLPMHKKKFSNFIQQSLKVKKDKYVEEVEELYNILMKNMRRISQTPELKSAAEIPFKSKKVVEKKKKKASKPITKVKNKNSELSKSQKDRLKRKKRVLVAKERDGDFTPMRKKKLKPKSEKPKKSPGKKKLPGKKRVKK